jgi:hypothetical protein
MEVELAIFEQGDAGGVISSIFEASEAFDENWLSLLFTKIRDYSTHIKSFNFRFYDTNTGIPPACSIV